MLHGRTGTSTGLTRVKHRLALPIIALVVLTFTIPREVRAMDEVERQRVSTAVALNYSRAAFYRIQKSQSKRVLFEEQEKILNNLNLNEIADEEVVRLYTAVLQEISEIRLAGKEKGVIDEQYKRALTNSLVVNAFDFGTQLATSSYLAAVRTGARSWWDYRSLEMKRDVDAFRVEKDRMIAIVDKSSHFLDTFWKLARKRTIPDRWLIRGQDLDRLEAAIAEPDLTVRLRVLKRMEEFMECYPPYWYYVGRTQQGLGQLFAAAQTYEKLAAVGSGHFRKDEMLAAALANRAVIQEYLHQQGADETARQALAYSTDAWEANLMCARVLAQHGHVVEAEDAILRNLDVGLEREQSLAALVSLHAYRGNKQQLTPLLNDPGVLRFVPTSTLVQCGLVLGVDQLPRPAAAQLLSSIFATYDLHFGPDDLLITASPAWQLRDVPLRLEFNGQTFDRPEVTHTATRTEIHFRNVGEFGRPLQTVADTGDAVLTMKYSDFYTLRVSLSAVAERSSTGTGTNVSYASTPRVETPSARRNTLYIAEIQSGKESLTFRGLPDGAQTTSSAGSASSISAPVKSESKNPDDGASAPGHRKSTGPALQKPSTSPFIETPKPGGDDTAGDDVETGSSSYVPPLPPDEN